MMITNEARLNKAAKLLDDKRFLSAMLIPYMKLRGVKNQDELLEALKNQDEMNFLFELSCFTAVETANDRANKIEKNMDF